MEKVELGTGSIEYGVEVAPELFYKVLGDECGCEIKGDFHLIALMRDLVEAKKEYDRVAEALKCAEATGYGVVAPSMDEMVLEEPEMVKQGSRFGVKLKASAPSLHIIKVDVKTEVNPKMCIRDRAPCNILCGWTRTTYCWNRTKICCWP